MPLPFIIILSTFLRLPVSQTSRNLLLLPSLFFQVALRCKPYVSLVLFFFGCLFTLFLYMPPFANVSSSFVSLVLNIL